MAILDDFDIANDLKVEMLLPQDVNNVFVLGVSLLGGDDVLGTDESGTLAWQDLACEVNLVRTSLGGSIASNVYFQADAGKATIQLQSWEFDPNNYSYIRPGTQVRVRIARGDYSFVLWHGTVDNIDVSYAPDEQNQMASWYLSRAEIRQTSLPASQSTTWKDVDQASRGCARRFLF